MKRFIHKYCIANFSVFKHYFCRKASNFSKKVKLTNEIKSMSNQYNWLFGCKYYCNRVSLIFF